MNWTALIILLVIIAAPFLWAIAIYNGLVHAAQPLQERVRADRRAAEAPLRPDPEPGRDGQGLHHARARDAGSGDRGAQRRDGRDADGGGRRRATRRRCRASRRPKAALGGALGRLFAVFEAYPDLKANQNMMQLSGGAHQHREQDRLRAPGLQRHGDGATTPRASPSPTTSSPACSASAPATLLRGDRVRRRAQGAQGFVQVSAAVASAARTRWTSSKTRSARGATPRCWWCCSRSRWSA